MDLSYTAEEEAFRARVREWIAKNKPAGDSPSTEDLRAWQRRLHQAGFLGAAWPKEHGGAGLSPMEQAILNEELARANAPTPARLDGDLLGRPRDPALRQRGAEAPLHPAAALGRRHLGDRLLRAGRRQRHVQHADPRGARRRQLP